MPAPVPFPCHRSLTYGATRHRRATVSTECVEAYNELKLGKKVKYIIYRLTDDFKEIVIEDKSEDTDWDVFRTKLLGAKQTSKGKESAAPRYAVYDFQYEREGGEGQRYASIEVAKGTLALLMRRNRNVLAFISWSPDEGSTIHVQPYYRSV